MVKIIIDGVDKSNSEITSLTELSDVTLTSVANDNLLQFNSTSGEWENVTFSSFEGTIDHVNILNIGTNTHSQVDTHLALTNEHIDHSGVSITAGSGLTGGGTIASTRTIDLDINSLSVATIASGDFVPFWDITATATNKKITFANFEGTLNHDNLTGFATNEHFTESSIDHTGIQNIGTNTHAQVDTHLANTSNPHSVDAADVSLGNVTNVATSDTAYNATSWNTNTDSATKNAIRDQVEIMITAEDLNTTHRGSSGSEHADVATNTTHRGLTNDPHSVTASQVGLGNVSNVATDDTAYNATSWNTNTDSATKNAIRDKVETMDTAIGSNTTHRGLTDNPHSVSLAQVGGTTDHTALSNIGTNSHASIDTHLALTSEHIDWTNATEDLLTTGSGTVNNLTVNGTGQNIMTTPGEFTITSSTSTGLSLARTVGTFTSWPGLFNGNDFKLIMNGDFSGSTFSTKQINAVNTGMTWKGDIILTGGILSAKPILVGNGAIVSLESEALIKSGTTTGRRFDPLSLIGANFSAINRGSYEVVTGVINADIIGGKFTTFAAPTLIAGTPTFNYFGGKFEGIGNSTGNTTSYGGFFSGRGSNTNYGIWVDEGASVFNDDLWFETSGSGLVYGMISATDNTTETTITTQGTAVQVLIFDTNGPSNNTSPDHTNDHITITKAGDYMLNCSVTLNSVVGAGSRVQLTAQKNNGDSLLTGIHSDKNVDGGGIESGTMTMSGIITLSVNDTIEIWVENETNTQNYTIESISLSLIQIGG